MAATTTLLGLVTPTQGTLTGTWGDTVNYGISDYLDIAIAGTLSFAGDGAITLANTTGSSSGNSIGATTAQYAIIKVTGTLTTAKIITGPSYSKTYLVVNAATGSTVTFKASAQTGVSIAVGETALVYYNGTDYVKVVGTATAGAAGGSNTQVQYNNSGVLAGITGATTNGTALTLVAPVLGTPASATLTNATGLPISTGVSGLGTNVATALGVNTGTAGAFVVNGGALGSPSTAGTMPAFTLGGTVSGGGNQINNVVIGTTTPLAGNFTTLSANSETISTQLTLGGVVASGVATGIALRTGSTKTAWLVGAQYTTNNAFEITPSTAAGGTTFTTPVVTVTSTGLAVTGTLSATAAGASGADDRIFTVTNTTANSYGAMTLVGTSRGGYLNFYNGATAQAAIVGQASALDIYAGSNSSGSLVARFSSTALALQTGISLTGGTSGTGYSFSGSAPATSLTLDASGNLGIGTSSLSQKLTVSSAETSGTAVNIINTSTGGYSWNIFSVGSAASLGPVGSLVFRDSTNGATRALIDSSGNLLVGTTSSIGNGGVVQIKGPGATLYIEINSSSGTQNVIDIANVSNTAYKPMRFWVNGYATTEVGSITCTTSLTSYNTSSDYRLKENIIPMTGALAKVAQLNPVIYKWKTDGSNGQGFIAHELAEVVPDCVTGEKDAVDENGKPQYQAMDTSHLIATLVSAIQEQQALITQLTARITALEGA